MCHQTKCCQQQATLCGVVPYRNEVSPYTQPSLSATHSSWAGASTYTQAVARPRSLVATSIDGAASASSLGGGAPGVPGAAAAAAVYIRSDIRRSSLPCSDSKQ